jgi:hypothetical protein
MSLPLMPTAQADCGLLPLHVPVLT